MIWRDFLPDCGRQCVVHAFNGKQHVLSRDDVSDEAGDMA